MPPTATRPVESLDSLLSSCREAASRSLRANYRRVEEAQGTKIILVSGSVIYQHVHGRDFSLGCAGALALKDFDAVRDTLDVAFGFQRHDGLLPRAVAPYPPYLMIAADSFGWKTGFKAPLRPNFTSELFVRNYDTNAFWAWAVRRYAEASGDWEFARARYRRLVKAMDWYEPRKKDGLVSQRPFSDWQDNIGRSGRVSFTNVVYWIALKAMEETAARVAPDDAELWRGRAERFREKARAFFWDEREGALRNSERIAGIETGANLLAAAWGFIGAEDAARVFEAFERRGMWRRLGLRATDPDYPVYMKSPFGLLAGNHDYHDRQVWSWQTALAALALHRMGDTARARRVLEPMARLIAREGKVGEVYEDEAQVTRRLFKSECPFTWGSGMWLETLSELGVGEPAAASRADFPPDFLWGAATAAYQVEGGNESSDLHAWEKERGWEPCGKAVNSLELFQEDVRLLKELGANAYRFSMEWGRVVPEPGRPDVKALDYYQRLLDALRAAGIAPVVTTHHFTNPSWLKKRHPKGWMEPGTIEDYLEFVRVLAGRFGAQVGTWATFNEPMVYLTNGYLTGIFPPGKRGVLGHLPTRFMPAVENVARAHREAYGLLSRPGARVGIVQNISVVDPWKEEPEHQDAAERWDWFFHWNLLDAAQKGTLDLDLDGRSETTLDAKGACLDFLGVNYYTGIYARGVPLAFPPVHAFPFHAEVTYDRLGKLLFKLAGGRLREGVVDDLGHVIYPEGLRRVLLAAWRRYRLPVMVTENGVADTHGRYRDFYVREHLRELRNAVEDGVPVLGYLHWSLMDNYEWGSFKPKLGLYRVDRADGFKRALTPGGRAYRDFLAGDGARS